MKFFKFLIFLFLLSVQSCNSQTSKKINGISFVASRDTINQTHVNPVANLNANYAAIMPFGFIKSLDYPEITFNTDRQWFGETKKGVKQYVTELRKQNIKIMIKPQIWVWGGAFTGDIVMKSEADWKVLEDSYSSFILQYATLATNVRAELFCIGTELETFIVNRPSFWNALIEKIKKKYKGKLTYAANWDEYKHTPFWSKLDYIGIDAYFPVSNSKTPSIQACLQGWENHKQTIHEISRKYSKSIMFTEFGYRSVDYTGKAPWRSDRSMEQVNLEAQMNATQALFKTFWGENWFAGGFIWKWFHNHKNVGGKLNSRFTPQNKPVELVIKKQYSLK